MKKYILAILLVVSVCLTGCKVMTEEERAAYEASKWHEYQVVSVYQYISTKTNNFGAILDQELKYCFTYMVMMVSYINLMILSIPNMVCGKSVLAMKISM